MAKHTPTEHTRGMVEAYASTGMPQDKIAKTLGMSIHTLRRHYGTILETAQSRRVHEVANNLYQTALTARGMPGVVASIFILKVQGKWVEWTAGSHENADGSPVQTPPPMTIVLGDNGRQSPEFMRKHGYNVVEGQRAPPMMLASEALPIGRK
jgi:DNA-binding CsgD family transcriptional regulator